MKPVFILALFSVWMFSCNGSGGRTADSARADSPLIDSLVPLLSAVVANTDTTPADPTYHAEFKVLYTAGFCGSGVQPTAEMIAEKAKPKPLTASTLKFKNHFSGKEYFIETNAEGIGAAEMEEGKYDVFLTKDINSKLPTGFDATCSRWLDQLLLTVKVTAAGKMQDVTIHFICNPCNPSLSVRP